MSQKLKATIRRIMKWEQLGTPTAKETSQSPEQRVQLLPGVLLCLIVSLVCLLITSFFPTLSSMLLAILLGMLLRNIINIPEILEPGIAFSAKRILRWGVVLLGVQVSLSDIVQLGVPVLILDVFAVTITFLMTIFIGKLLKVDKDLTSLIAAGFSICGAAAIAGFQGTIKAAEEKVAAAVALVVLFGTLMIAQIPVLIHLLDLNLSQGATLMGASIHEVAQVVATAGIMGSAYLTVATMIKLARVSLMAPAIFIFNLFNRQHQKESQMKPALIPLFVVGFILMVVISSLKVIPTSWTEPIKYLQQLVLGAAMFGLGLGVHFKSLKKLGLKPILLGLISTTTIIFVVLICISLGLFAHIY
ncbi:YeiH family protein [Lactococcus fujiensis]|uniref:Sulfate exporter family transporter n=1 Tax=Lactococcus fujiensis JCM 16395 TaxID=1291764 RepID=A0A2A5RJF3_9LACT|nr:putative sulfate exporter family transporter [Lactococcus fujiensis]PCR99235.1 hypothetical protein RT41_GL000426 [Lactococcus fujiensis JCM 16395]